MKGQMLRYNIRYIKFYYVELQLGLLAAFLLRRIAVIGENNQNIDILIDNKSIRRAQTFAKANAVLIRCCKI